MRFKIFASFFLLFVATTSGFDLKCKSHTGQLAYVFVTYCEVQLLTITTPNEKITSVNGASTPTSFEGIRFGPLTIHYLPKGLGEFFPRMKELYVLNCSLKSIEASDLKNLGYLESLFSHTNAITEVSSDLFKFTPKLQHVTFYNNRISAVGKDLMTYLKLNSLIRLVFEGNKCINSNAHSNFESFKTELRTKCPDPNEKLATENVEIAKTNQGSITKPQEQTQSSEDLKKYQKEISDLKAENARIKQESSAKLPQLQAQNSEGLKKYEKENGDLKDENTSMKQESSAKLQEITQKSEELKKFKQENSDLKAKIVNMRRDWYDGLLDSCTKLLYEETKKLRKCEQEKDSGQVLIDEEEITATVLNTTEAQISLGLKIASPESKIVEFVDLSGNEVQPNQTEIVIDQQQAIYLPVNLGQIFSSARKLSVTFSGLFKLDARTFYNMDKLIKVNFTGNKIIEISEGIFSEMPNLQEIDLSFNNIRIISKNAFMNNKNLEIVKLNHNQLAKIDAELFSKQEKLKKLFLNDNKLKFIDADFLTPLKALEVVDFSKNVCIDVSNTEKTLEEISAIITEKCIAPVEVNCKKETNSQQINENTCEIEELMLVSPKTTLIFAENVKAELIENLSLFDQKMLFVPLKLYKSLPSLLSLNIENSSLTTLQKGNFEGLSQLQILKIVKNNISLIEEGVFDEIPQIVHLNLANNNIEFLPPKAFSKLMKLEILILAGNRLKKFTANLMPPKRNAIKELQLQDNQLEFIESKVLKLLRNAEVIDLSGNVCIDMRYQKSDPNGKTLKDMNGEVDFDCDEDTSD